MRLLTVANFVGLAQGTIENKKKQKEFLIMMELFSQSD